MQIFGRETRLIMGKVKVANLSILLLSSFIVLQFCSHLLEFSKNQSQIHQFRKSLLTLNSQVSHYFPDYPSYTESMSWSITLLKQKLYFGALIIIIINYYLNGFIQRAQIPLGLPSPTLLPCHPGFSNGMCIIYKWKWLSLVCGDK